MRVSPELAAVASLSRLLLTLLLVAGSAVAQVAPKAAPLHPSTMQQRPGHAAIASANFLATNAGHEVLAEGGNAFDAAIAVAATLSVVEPESSGIGGGFMAVLHRAKDGHDIFIDARETAPAAVDRNAYLNADGSPNRDAALKGPLSAGIPGEPAGLVLIAEKLRSAATAAIAGAGDPHRARRLPAGRAPAQCDCRGTQGSAALACVSLQIPARRQAAGGRRVCGAIWIRRARCR